MEIKNLELLKSHKNLIFRILEVADLEPANFSWVSVPSIFDKSLLISRLKYRNSSFYFQFDYLKTQEYCLYSPGITKAVEKEHPGSWKGQIGYVKIWAKTLKYEIDTPDLWKEIEKYRATFSLVPSDKLSNEPIPAYEVEEIGKALKLLATEIKKMFNLTNQQNQFVQSKLSYLEEATKRQGRLDWVYTCIGVLITIAIELTMQTNQAKELWQLAKNLLGKFLHLISP